MLKNRYVILFAYIGIVLCVLVLGLTTYAYITVDLSDEENETPIDIKTYNKNVEVTYVDTSNVSMVNAYTGQKIVKTFYVENTGEGIAYYDLILEDVINNFSNKNDLIYNIKSDCGVYIHDKVLPSTDASLASNIEINVGDKHTYELTIQFLQTEENQNDNMNKTFSSNINIVASKGINAGQLIYEDDTLLKEIITSNPESIESDNYKNNKDGVYYTFNSINGTKTYFYKGSNNLNNNVLIGDTCYKIIRTTESVGIKLIYNGKYVDGKCTNSLDEKVSYNSFSNYNAYVGYMYGNVSSDNYEKEHSNQNSSDIKKYLDVWYNNNVKDYEDIIDTSTIYCNNRTTNKFNYGGVLYNTFGYSNLNTGYLLMNNYYINDDKDDIAFDCDINDRFSVNSGHGNNKLNYSIGLLTIEEAYYAGFVPNKNTKAKSFKTINSDNYLNNGTEYITMTPAYYNGQDAYNFVISKNRVIPGKVSSLYNVRPVIGVKKDAKIIRGTGTDIDPYVLAEAPMKEESDEQ